jgi:hypothetical protein
MPENEGAVKVFGYRSEFDIFKHTASSSYAVHSMISDFPIPEDFVRDAFNDSIEHTSSTLGYLCCLEPLFIPQNL